MTTGRLSDPPVRQILGVEQIDDLGAALIALTRELWVVIDRMTMLETLLARHGIPVAELDVLQPDEATAALLAKRREKLIGTVVAALQGER
ncbi:MAG: hypothetical protein JWO15_1684 [Sphingomonadales bacterium]|nr:hypothetical protein [Sphingomonadales bacterium]